MRKEIPIKNFYYLLSYAWDSLTSSQNDFLNNDNFTNTTNLMAKLIVLSFNDLIKDGLEKSYISKTKDITGIKGRLCLGDTVKSGKLIYGRTYCEFDEYGFDSHNNRIIKSCVTLLLRLSDLTIENYYSLRQILNLLESVTDIKFESVKFNQIRLNNFNRNYRFILELCKLISNSLTVSDQTGEIHLSGFIDETLSKDRIYEKFIKNFYSKHLKTAKVSSPRFDWEIGETSDDIFKDRVPELRTDVVIDYPNSRLIIDAKFYAEALKQNYGKFKYRREHLSQLMEYIRSSTKEKSVPTQGMLLYPTVNNEINDSGKIEGNLIRVATIDLSKDWKEIESSMLDLVSSPIDLHINAT